MATETSNQLVSCQECHKEPAKYSCPACFLKTCSLACCKAHKVSSKCTGKRSRTQYMPLAHMNDATLTSDYHFLEDVLSQVDGGKRLLNQVGATGNKSNHSKKRNTKHDNNEDQEEQDSVHVMLKILQHDDDKDEPPHKRQRTNKWQRLVQQAHERGVTLMLMPTGMQRHESNTSWYQHKMDTIHWKVDLNIQDDDGKKNPRVVSIRAVDENTPLFQLVAKTIPEIESCEFHLLLKKLPCPSNQPRYVELDRQATLKEALREETIIEYPAIQVVPNAALQRFPRSIAEVEQE